MGTPYFASLADKALMAAKSNLTDVQGEVARLLAQWGHRLPQPGLPRRAGDVRDDLQEALNQALSSRLEKDTETGHQSPACTLEVQINVLDSRLQRIEQVVGKIESALGDWGWGEQASYLCEKYEPQKRFTGERNWSEFLPKITSPRHEATEGSHSIRQQTLNRLNDLNALVDSYGPLMARRLAADLTAHSGKCSFYPGSAGPDVTHACLFRKMFSLRDVGYQPIEEFNENITRCFAMDTSQESCRRRVSFGNALESQ
jgi:hypothetical protein